MRLCVLVAVIAIMVSTAIGQEDSSSYWSNKGYDFLFKFDYQDALNSFDKAISIDPTDRAALAGRANALEHLGNYSDSLEVYNKILEIAPNYVKAWVGKGLALSDLNRSNESLESFNKAIELDPEYIPTWNERAWLLIKMGNYEKAVEDANKGITLLNRELAKTLDTEGVALEGMGKYKQALEYFNKSIELEPSIAEIWFHKGDALMALGRENDANAAYAEAKNLTLVWPGGEDIDILPKLS
jgi:tetratricopeptide (TPR) repeat protein